jgi:hypothetical protein
MGGEQDLLIVADSGNLQVVLDGAKPIIGVEGFSALGEDGWIGALEILQLGAGVSITIPAIIVVGVSGSDLCEVLKGSKVSFSLRTGGLSVFKHNAQELSHGRVRGWRGVLVRPARVSSTGVHHPEEEWIQMFKGDQVDGQPHKKGRNCKEKRNFKDGRNNMQSRQTIT